MYDFAQYIFFASTLYLFGDHISPRSQLYWEQQEEMKVTCLGTQQRRCQSRKRSGALQRSDQKGSIQTEGEEDELRHSLAHYQRIFSSVVFFTRNSPDQSDVKRYEVIRHPIDGDFHRETPVY
jgi:hypothetical protein